MKFEGKKADWADEFFGESKREVPLWLYEAIEVAFAISLIAFISSLAGLVWVYIDIEAGVTSTLILTGLITSVLGLAIFGRLKSTCVGVSKKMLEAQCYQLEADYVRKAQALIKLDGPSAMVSWRNQTDFVREPVFGDSWSELRERRDWRKARLDDFIRYFNLMSPTAKL